MICNGTALLNWEPIKDMEQSKLKAHGTSYGLGEAGYDIRIKQDIRFITNEEGSMIMIKDPATGKVEYKTGRFCLASAIEQFQMPHCLVATVRDKSTWARRGLSVFNTVIEPGWRGFLTLELVFHGNEPVHIPAGAGIAQVLFDRLEVDAVYDGKYQDQEDKPVDAIAS